jgi:uncharacterized membrane protein
MSIPGLLLLAATLLVALTTGIVYAFAVVVMPGLHTLPDREFLNGFRVMDRIIQDNDPRFLLVWVGALVLLIAAVVAHAPYIGGGDDWLLLAALTTYVLGVQVPTFAVNIPLNNRLQTVVVEALDPSRLRGERDAFEARWVFWNWFRTAFGVLTVVLLLVVLA